MCIPDPPTNTTVDESCGVLVMGTMSSGKTALINALIGKEMLPSANEATTACLTSIKHKQGAKLFSGSCYSVSGHKMAVSEDVSLDTVRIWSATGKSKRITLTGNFRSVPKRKSGLILHDTPGPNNSQDERHAQLLFEALHTVDYKILCYVMNAAQFGIADDRRLLDKLIKYLAKRKNILVYFILNKTDLLDPEKGEYIDDCVKKVRCYLVDIGFENPVIVPTMANIALVARKTLFSDSLTRSERAILRWALGEVSDDFSSLGIKKQHHNLLRLVGLRFGEPVLQGFIERRKLHKLEDISGVKAVESLIHKHFQVMG